MQKLTRHQGAKTLAAALFALVGPSAFAITKAYTFGATLDDPTSKNGNAEGNAAVLRTEAGIDLSATAKKATSPANTLINFADKDFTTAFAINADASLAQRPMFSIDAYNLAAGKKLDAEPIVIQNDAAAKKAQLDYVGAATVIDEASARLLLAIAGVEVTGVYFKVDGSQFDAVDAMVKELAGKGLIVFGAYEDGAVQGGDKRLAMVSGDDDAWTKAYCAMLGGNKFTLLADDEATSDFDINGTYGKLATSGLGAARTQKAVFA